MDETMVNMGRTRRRLAVVALFSVLGAMGCTRGSLVAPDTAPEQTGIVVEIGQTIRARVNRPDQLLQVWVANSVDDECGAIYIVTAETVIGVLDPEGGDPRAGTLADIRVGVDVQVWSGIVELSCPGLGAATWLLVR
jgi:hypothetical protein